jgi:hypothetical protein
MFLAELKVYNHVWSDVWVLPVFKFILNTFLKHEKIQTKSYM